MRFISTRTHGYLDYGVSILLIIAPFTFGFATGGPAMWVPILLGAGTILYSLFTDYELGVARRIPMPTHLALDATAGGLLAISPWLFGFHELVFWPHVILGTIELIVANTTFRAPAGLTTTGRVRS